jgi:hypothetical protein
MTEPAWLLCMVWQFAQGPATFAAAGEKKAATKISAVRTTDMVKNLVFISSSQLCNEL